MGDRFPPEYARSPRGAHLRTSPSASKIPDDHLRNTAPAQGEEPVGAGAADEPAPDARTEVQHAQPPQDLQSMLIATDDVQKTEEELEAEFAARAEAEQNAPSPEMVKLQVEREVAQLRFDVEMAKIAANGELTLEEIAAERAAVWLRLEGETDPTTIYRLRGRAALLAGAGTEHRPEPSETWGRVGFDRNSDPIAR